MAKPSQSYVYSSTSFLLMFTSWAIWWAFFQIWLTSESGGLMLNGAEVGTIFAVNGFFTVAWHLFYGSMQDKLGLKKHLLILVAIAATLNGPFVTWVYRPLLTENFSLAVVLGGIVFSAGFSAAIGLCEAYFDRLARRDGFVFGRARMWGSFGYAVAVLCAGFLYTQHPLSIFWASSGLGLALLIVHLVWGIDSSTSRPESGTSLVDDFRVLARQPKMWALVVFVLLSWTFYTIFESQMFPDFYTTHFATPAEGQRVYGILTSVQTFTEATLMFLVPLLMDKIGVKRTITLGAFVMVIPVAGSAISSNVFIISAAKFTHCLMIPLIVLGIMRYVTLHFNERLSATIYLLGFYVTQFLGSVVLSSPLGALRDSVGYSTTFWVIAGVIACSVVAAHVMLRDDSQGISTVDMP